MGNCLENCCPQRNYEPIVDKSTHPRTPNSSSPKENGTIQRITDERARAEEEKRISDGRKKQENLSNFLKVDDGNGTLSIAEQKAQFDKAEREKQAKLEEHKQAKLNEFLKVDDGKSNGAPLSLS